MSAAGTQAQRRSASVPFPPDCCPPRQRQEQGRSGAARPARPRRPRLSPRHAVPAEPAELAALWGGCTVPTRRPNRPDAQLTYNGRFVPASVHRTPLPACSLLLSRRTLPRPQGRRLAEPAATGSCVAQGTRPCPLPCPTACPRCKQPSAPPPLPERRFPGPWVCLAGGRRPGQLCCGAGAGRAAERRSRAAAGAAAAARATRRPPALLRWAACRRRHKTPAQNSRTCMRAHTSHLCTSAAPQAALPADPSSAAPQPRCHSLSSTPLSPPPRCRCAGGVHSAPQRPPRKPEVTEYTANACASSRMPCINVRLQRPPACQRGQAASPRAALLGEARRAR